MRLRSRAYGFAAVDLAAVLAVLVVLLSIALPVIGGVQGNAGVQQSMSNLTMLGLAHVVYAADWNGRQVTWARDDLGAYGGSIQSYNESDACQFDGECQPPLIAGWGETLKGNYALWAYWSGDPVFWPISFPPGGGAVAFGNFRFPNAKAFHDYVNGRYHDSQFFAPNDTAVLSPIEDCLDEIGEFVAYPESCNPAWSSYCMSPAAMFHPDVMRSNAAGGWQDPRLLDHGFESPGFFQATYPNLKTLMIEHSWIQNSPPGCSPYFSGCEPYWFNHGIDSTPVTLFYDGSVRLLPNSVVAPADFQVLSQSGGVDGLWHRGTSFGPNGYFIDSSYDGTPLSHHILTTDGILGRDTLAEGTPIPQAARFTAGKPSGPRNRVPSAAIPRIWTPPPFTAQEEGQP